MNTGSLEDPTSEASAAEEVPDGDDPLQRYGFAAYLGQTWTLFRTCSAPSIAVSSVLHLIAGFIPFLIFFSVPESAALPLIFLVRVVVPVVAGSLAVAVISVLILQRRTGQTIGVREAAALARGAGVDLWAMSLIATMLAIVAVLFLGAYGFLVLHFFYGPPVAMQVLTAEGRPLRESLSSARRSLRGSWRLVLYLFSLSLLAGLLTFVLLGAAFSVLYEGAEAWSSPALAASQGLVTGLFGAVMAAAQTALYLQVRTDVQTTAAGDPTELAR